MALAEKQEFPTQTADDRQRCRHSCQVVHLGAGQPDPGSPGENFINELEALGRRYLAANGGNLTGSREEVSIRISTRMAMKHCP